MIIFPAVDILDGKCVRLMQGRYDKVTSYNADPLDAAKRWQDEGAEFLHVVDLNGAADGEPKNLSSLSRIVENMNIPIQFGGGIRGLESLERVLGLGVKRAVLGTSIINSPDFVSEVLPKYGDSLAAGLDSRGGKVAIEGWTEDTEKEVVEVAKDLDAGGISAIIFTDIDVDGTQHGINYNAIRSLASEVVTPVIASGGVATIDDIHRLKEIESSGVSGVIIGRALYEGSLLLPRALEVANS